MSTAQALHPPLEVNKGLWVGLLGIVIFSATLPLTKLAVGSALQPQLSPWFVTFGRAAVAGVLSVLYLLVQWLRGHRHVPGRHELGLLLFTALGVVIGFPLFLSLALQHVPSTHGSVVTGLLPLATAVVAALWYRQRPGLSFWLCAVMGTGLVLAFMLLRSSDSAGHFRLHLADVLLLLAMLSAALGYVGGARLTPSLGAERVICWVLVLSLPLTVPAAVLNVPADWRAIQPASWWAFAYVAVFSMWLGFFAWYRGLALGGAVRVSQVQLVQPFLSLLFAVPLMGESLDGVTLGFGVAVVATVFVSKKMPVGPATS
ncbi:MAG: eamA-like transporter family protein [Polaromonas sp.]|nr:eamA-like transporter family protein [Polaromonas sp.]